MHNELPYAVILGIADTGYGVARSLAPFGIPIIAFESDTTRPEIRTNLCEVNIFSDEIALLNKLLSLSSGSRLKPLLYITSDALVMFYNTNRHILADHFLIDFPSQRTTNLLMEKGKFATFARDNGLAIPKTKIIQNRYDVEACAEEMAFPCLLKPYWRDVNWKRACFPKVFSFFDRADFLKRINAIFSVEHRLVLQEWIPGGDSDIYFTLTYYDSNSRCLADFTGRKLRQWPILTGSTCCAEPSDNHEVRQTTISLFDQIQYSGFGSVEFKKHQVTGKLFIMEPTVGRPNHQSFIAAANGINMPLVAYMSLTGLDIFRQRQPKRSSIWIDEQFDILSIIVGTLKGQLNLRHLIRSYLKCKSFRFINRKDMMPFFYALLISIYKAFRLIMNPIKGPLRDDTD